MIKAYNKNITAHLQVTNILLSYFWFNMLCITGMGELWYLFVFALLTLNCSVFLVSIPWLFLLIGNRSLNMSSARLLWAKPKISFLLLFFIQYLFLLVAVRFHDKIFIITHRMAKEFRMYEYVGCLMIILKKNSLWNAPLTNLPCHVIVQLWRGENTLNLVC